MSIWRKRRNGWALAEDYLEAQAEEAVKKLTGRRKGRTEDGGTELLLERKGFLEEPEALKAYILRHCLRELAPENALYNVSALHLAAIAELAGKQSGRSLDLPGEVRAYTEGSLLVFEKGKRLPEGKRKKRRMQQRNWRYRAASGTGNTGLPHRFSLIKAKLFRKTGIRNGLIMIQLRVRFKYGPEEAVIFSPSRLQAEGRL